MGDLKPWHIIVICVFFLLLFGAKKLPDAARSLGQSLRIFKAETKGLREDDDSAGTPAVPAAPAAQQPAQVAAPSAPVSAPASNGSAPQPSIASPAPTMGSGTASSASVRFTAADGERVAERHDSQ